MTELIVFWTAIIVLAVVFASLREILSDGYGHTAPPRGFRDSDPFAVDPAGRRAA